MKHTRQNHMKAKHEAAKDQDSIRANLERQSKAKHTKSGGLETHGADVDAPEKLEAKSDAATEGKSQPVTKVKKQVQEEREALRAIFKDTISNVTETVNHAKETWAQARQTVEVLKGTKGKVLAHIKENPEPFIEATVPGLIGVYFLVQKARKMNA